MNDWPDDAVVVRGGIMADPAAVRLLIEDADEDGYGPVLSVFVADPALHGGHDAAVQHACLNGRIPHAKVRVARYADIADGDRVVVLDVSDGQADCHHHVVFPAVPTMVEIETFLALFEEPIQNPAKESGS
ncbi:hypothetical protein [Microbacterium aurantiacum]|uniref:hypothetical protein n=1 Tax=Microbacterium aurantiacum TaxID=162393 RepID=UPI0012E269E0|nr:hypothetical protein [Microbacterium chocolatum]